ncbi:MAG: SDR family oxidoreductase [Proteobacteria bacterium]|nr:SDR family oxidoreductase [Pseudomonadota bacterium]
MDKNYYQDKIALVTGGAFGIGKALCQELSKNGATVIVADIDLAEAKTVALSIAATGASAKEARLDVARREEFQELIDATVSEYGRLDFVFNNAGIYLMGEVRDMEPEHWDRLLDVNLKGVVHGTTEAYRVMTEQGFGHIVNVASVSGLIPSPMETAYATTKWAVVGLSTSLRIEAEDLGVRVSVACPGYVNTEMGNSATVLKAERRELFSQELQENMMDPADCAWYILHYVARNQAVIPVTGMARRGWRLFRYFPSFTLKLLRRKVDWFRSVRQSS